MTGVGEQAAVSRFRAASPQEAFLGLPGRSVSVAGFEITLWFAEIFGDEIHEHEHELAHLMVVLSGGYRSRVWRADEEDAARPVIFNPPGTQHRDRFLTPGSFMSITISADRWGAMAGELPRDDPVGVQGGGIAFGLVPKLMRVLAGTGQHESPVGENLCLDLLGLVSTRACCERRRPRWLDRATDALTSDVARDITLAEVAAAAGVHACHMTRTFRAFERCTPGEYLMAARLRRAADLLSEARLPLVEVGLASGFADQSHFCKRFREAYGVTPGEYRRRTARRRIIR